MINLKELVSNATVRGNLLVVAASVEKTKTGKAYLKATMQNKTGKVEVRRWDFNEEPPTVGTVVNVFGTVSLFMDQPQLTLSMPLYEVTDYDMSEFIQEVCPNFDEGVNETLVDWLKVQLSDTPYSGIFDAFEKSAYYEQFKMHTAAIGIHHAGMKGLLKHSLEVLLYAENIYHALPPSTQMLVDRPLLLIGAFLHDVGKVQCYQCNNGVWEYTPMGHLLDHSVLGAELIAQFSAGLMSENTLMALQHIILSHHGKLEYGAAVKPASIEAVIVNVADGLSAKLDTIATALQEKSDKDMWTKKLFSVDNTQFYSNKE